MCGLKKIISIMLACLPPVVTVSQTTIDIASIIHVVRANEDDSTENLLFYDIRKSIPSLSRWENNGLPDTIYALESWNYSSGTFTLMYWNRTCRQSVLQTNANDSVIAYNRRAYTKRIISLVEEWDSVKIDSLSHTELLNKEWLYATRIVLYKGSFCVETQTFPYIFLKEDLDDASEIFTLWHDSNTKTY